MEKLLYVAPHLSTGGLPQYLCKKIELLKDNYEIYLVEWSDVTGGILVVTRNKILKLVDKDKFFTLSQNKQELIEIIARIKPDIIHLEEIPEYFLDVEIAEQIYTSNRKYSIVETSHDSSYDTTQKKFFPDKFMFVSEWQIQQYKNIDIPKVVVEYPIEYIERPNRQEALQKLGLDPNKKHILHVGLFTPRKNQAEFFEYAKALPQYEFHCLGNQADNFKYYWEPLMKDKPSNLTWWNERTDVDNFYQAMDLFLFTSRGTNNDKETMPLVIREAVSYQIPVLIYNLPVYLNYWDSYPVEYLDFNDLDLNCKKIIDIIDEEIIETDEEVFIISTYPSQQSVINATKECILAAKASDRKVILTSHLPIPEELQSISDYCVYDANNLLTKHDFYKKSWVDYENFKAEIYLQGEGNDVYHGPAVYTNYYNGINLAKHLGFRKAYLLNYDYILTNPEFIDQVSAILNKKHIYTDVRDYPEGKVSSTFFTGVNVMFYSRQYPKILNAESYDNLKNIWKSKSNGFENLYYHSLLKNQNDVYFETKENWDLLISQNFKHLDFSRVEYFTVMPVKGCFDNYALYYQNSNAFDTRKVIVSAESNNELIFEETLDVSRNFSWYRTEFRSQEDVLIKFKSIDIKTNKIIQQKEILLNQDYFDNQLYKNGLFTIK